jgi:CheY-like chemotaxis protein
MDYKNNKYNIPFKIKVDAGEQEIVSALYGYVCDQLADDITLPPESLFFTDHDGNTYLASGRQVSDEVNVATVVNSLNVFQQGYAQIGPWAESSSDVEFLPAILIIDGNADVRSMTASMLAAELDAHFIQAGSGEEALAFCRGISPDLVLLDLDLPDMDGFRVGAELKRMRCPFVAMTDMADIESIEKIVETGCISFVAKPAVYAQLVGTVLSALAQLKKRKVFHRPSGPSPDVCVASGALASYLSVSSDEAFQVIREIGRDRHSNSRDVAQAVNQFLAFLGEANDKHVARLERKKKVSKRR